MLTLAVVIILGGALLGFRYRVSILLPSAIFVLVVVVGVGVARGTGMWRIALDLLVTTTALQLGYVGGSAFAAARKRRKLRSRGVGVDQGLPRKDGRDEPLGPQRP